MRVKSHCIAIAHQLFKLHTPDKMSKQTVRPPTNYILSQLKTWVVASYVNGPSSRVRSSFRIVFINISTYYLSTWSKWRLGVYSTDTFEEYLYGQMFHLHTVMMCWRECEWWHHERLTRVCTCALVFTAAHNNVCKHRDAPHQQQQMYRPTHSGPNARCTLGNILNWSPT